MKKFLSAILAVVMIFSAVPLCRVIDTDLNFISISASAAQLNGLNKTNGKWYYYKNGKIDKSFEGMAKNQYGWWYVKNGTIDFTYTGMAKNQYGWWYMKNGKLDTTYTGMAKNQYGWWYMKNGKLDRTYTGMAKNQYGWWYLKNGTIDFTYTGIAKNQYGYWYIENGKLDTSANGIYFDENDNAWDINNGKAQLISERNTISVTPSRVELYDDEYIDITLSIYAPDGFDKVSYYLYNDDGTVYCEWNDWDYIDGDYASITLSVYGNRAGTEKIGLYFDDYDFDIKASVDVTVFTSEVSGRYYLELPDCPKNVSLYGYGNQLLSSAKITDIKCEVDQSADYLDAALTIYGTKTYAEESYLSSSCAIGYKLYNEDGVVVDSGTFYSPNVSKGESFILNTSIYCFDLEPGEYRLEILDVRY